jgi:hypothetical protein
MGTLYCGECWRTATVLDILRRYFKDEIVDLVYLDPPFNSAQNRNAFFRERDGTDAANQSKVRMVFAADPLAQFLQDFRNYITHYEIPHIGLSKRFGSALTNAESAELSIDLDHLASGFNWSAPSQKLIEDNKPQIRMLKLVDDYELKLKRFYSDLMLSFQTHFGRELGEIRSMMQESNNLWSKMIGEVKTPNTT